MPASPPNITKSRIFLVLDSTASSTKEKEERYLAIIQLHERLLVALGIAPDAYHSLPQKWWEREEIIPFYGELAIILQQDFLNKSLCIIDIPHILCFYPLWKKVLSDLAVEPLYGVAPDHLATLENNYTNNLHQKNEELASARQTIAILLNSTSWKITSPLRKLKTIGKLARKALTIATNPITYQRAATIIKNYGIRKVCKKALMVLKTQGVSGLSYYLNRSVTYELPDYQRWIAENDTLSDKDRNTIRQHIKYFAAKPLISIVMPVYNVEIIWLREAIDSVLRQLYPHFELCIADDCSTNPAIKKLLQEYSRKDKRIKVAFRAQNGHISESSNSALELATGEFIALMDHDDLLSEHALYYAAYEINKHPELDLIYSDEDKINTKGERYDPYFKSSWNPDLFYGQNMFSHLGVYRHSLLKKIGGFRKSYEGSQDYDLCLRCIKETTPDKIRHIPHILYHWRAIAGSTALSGDSKDYAALASHRAIADYFSSVNTGVTISDAASGGGYHQIHWPIPTPAPKITLIIPTRNAFKLLSTCIDSILRITDYPDYDIVIMNNQSDDPETLAYFAHLVATTSNVRVLDYDTPFNFSSINNFAVDNITSPLIGFINNDIEAIHAGWLKEMVSHALRDDIGAVGAKLYYPNNTLQHGGVVTGTGAVESAVATHLFHGLTKESPGYFGRALLTQSLSGVTAACLIMRKEVFNEVKGFEEKHLKVAFNDVDLCLKIREKGYRIIWTPYAELYHHESATRGYEDTPEKFARFQKEVAYMRQRWGEILDNDPYYNPNLDLLRGDFSLAFPSRAKKPWQVQ